MKRRDFFGAGVLAGMSAVPGSMVEAAPNLSSYKPVGMQTIPEKIAGMTLEELRDDYRDRLFNQYLPFWDKGGYDKTHGGFMCELRDDGSVEKDEKFIWYQGRAVWVYSFLYNYIKKDPRYLEIAEKTRDFMVKFMYNGDGTWKESVNRSGSEIPSTGQGSGSNIYGAMFSVAGLAELYGITKNKADLDIALASIEKSQDKYNDPSYDGAGPQKGMRAQGHTFMTIWPLSRLLHFYKDDALERLVREHVDHALNDFWNPEYGIQNEQLAHDYTRVDGADRSMSPGHTIETYWMVMYEALRIGNGTIFYQAKNRIRRVIEMCWDYVFDGWGTNSFEVFGSENRPCETQFDIKTMWAHVEILLATMTTLEYTGDAWALEWYERCRDFTIRAMPTDHGVWRQAVDRFGKDKKRSGISIYRKGNFHQPRYFLYNLLSLERMIKNNGKLTPFPL